MACFCVSIYVLCLILMTLPQELFSYVRRVGAGPEHVLHLNLVDTSGDDDVVISRYLVEHDLAALSSPA